MMNRVGAADKLSLETRAHAMIKIITLISAPRNPELLPEIRELGRLVYGQ